MDQDEKSKALGLVILWIFCAVASGMAGSSLTARVPSDEERLLELLFDGYNPSARPVINSSHTVNVMMQFALLQIQELNLRNQVLTTTGLLILEWRDERLSWDTQAIQLNEVAVEANKLWRPEFASINGADGIYGDYGHFRAIITYDGNVHWEPGGVFKTICEIDITYYPFDEQRCRLVFGAWSYPTTKMNLSNMDTVVNMDSFEANGEWEITNTLVIREEFSFDCCPTEKFSNIQFSIFLKRRYTFYIMNVILPSLMTSVLLLSIFFCTPAQKVQIGVVVLLSFRIFLLNVTDSIPKTSDHIPLLGIYLTCTMAITTLSMVLTVFVLNLHHVSDRPVPHWVKKLVLVYMARVLCMCQFGDKVREEEAEIQERKNKYRVTPNSLGKAIGSQIGLLAGLNGSLGPNKSSGTNAPSTGTGSASGVGVGGTTSGGDHLSPDADKYRDLDHGIFADVTSPYSNQYTYDMEEQRHHRRSRPDPAKQEEEWSREWRHLAEVIDRLFFWLFLSGIVITTLILFHPLTKTYFSLLGDETFLRGKSSGQQVSSSATNNAGADQTVEEGL